MAQQLVAEKILKTLRQLQLRIQERFPEAGLARVGLDLIDAAEQTTKRAHAAARPNLLLRFFVIVAIAVALVVAVAIAPQVSSAVQMLIGNIFSGANTAEFTQALESVVNLVILMGVAIWFLLSLEEREKRRFVLRHLHELRSFAHVIDMHQLTKDPISHTARATRTASSPDRPMTAFELARYLDYCSELLSIIGKLAALYGEQTNDTEVIGAVNDIEFLTNGIGRKVWQKIMIVHRNGLAADG